MSSYLQGSSRVNLRWNCTYFCRRVRTRNLLVDDNVFLDSSKLHNTGAHGTAQFCEGYKRTYEKPSNYEQQYEMCVLRSIHAAEVSKAKLQHVHFGTESSVSLASLAGPRCIMHRFLHLKPASPPALMKVSAPFSHGFPALSAPRRGFPVHPPFT